MALLTPAEVGELTRRHPETVTMALRRGELCGYQRKRKAPWVIEEACALAWRRGQECEHQAGAQLLAS